MNDFIVWYSDENNQNMFSEEFTLEQLINQDHLDIVSDSPLLRNFKVDSINNSIGIKDINGKSIYADCSIVEFEFGTISNKKLKGYFKYSNYTLGYHIVLVNDCNRGRAFRFDAVLMYDIKIIDTIQENKLGLIK